MGRMLRDARRADNPTFLGSKLARLPDPIHLHPTAPLAGRVLLPGDPGRALLLAQTLLEEPKMFNHNRGLWGYSGEAKADGEPLTIQSTGMGGPSAAIVIAELAELGAERLLRVGTCGALDEALDLGELLIVAEAVAADGTSRALGAGDTVAGDAELLAALTASAPEAPSGRVVSTDLFYDSPPGQEQEWLAAGARAVEMEMATLFALAARRGLRTGGLLIVSDQILPARRRIEPDALRASEERAGVVALRALSGQPAPASASEETRR
jgi:uridine phosphorylase